MSKRGENIYKRKDHRWEGRGKVGVGTDGRARYKSVYADSYTECKVKLKALLAQAAQPKTAVVPSLAFAELAQQWLEFIRPTVKESSFAAYHYIVAHYLPYFITYRMNQINQRMLELYLAMLLKSGGKNGRRGLSARTAANIFAVLKMILGFSEARYGIKNEVRTVKLPKQRPEREAVLSAAEWEQLARTLLNRKDQTALAVALGMYTGMRIGEICALRREDIDFTERVIHVRKTVQRVRNIDATISGKTRLVVGDPKSGSSVRKIPLVNSLLERLRGACKPLGKGSFLLGIDGKKPLDPRTMQYRFKSFLKKLEARDINFHGLRHSFATRCVEKKVDIKTLSEILGHSSVKMTLDRYVHASLDFKRRQLEWLEEAL